MKLKTLNEFKKFSVDDIKSKDFLGVAIQSRTYEASKKGYTCKIDVNPLFIHFELLRKEAIKWIKNKFNEEKCYDDTDAFAESCKMYTKYEFMDFFNITEEDLK